MEVGIPIVIPHAGDRFYLAHVIAQAKESNPSSDIILFVDKTNRYYSGLSHVDYNTYFVKAANFAEIYRHINPNKDHYKWILFCFQKWIALAEYAKQTKLKSFVVIDSDVLIFDNLTKIRKRFLDCEMTIIQEKGKKTAQAGLSFINDSRILDELSEICFSMFTPGGEFFEKVTSTLPAEGITEMNALALLSSKLKNKVRNIMGIQDDIFIQSSLCIDTKDVVFEGKIENKTGYQKLFWEQNMPFVKDVSNETLYRCPILHCHGYSKWKVIKLIKIKDFSNKTIWFYNFLRFHLLKYPRRVLNKVWKLFFKKDYFFYV